MPSWTATLLLFQSLSPNLKLKKNRQKILNQNFDNLFHPFCVLAHRSRVPSFMRITEKTVVGLAI